MISTALLCLGCLLHLVQGIPQPGHGALAGYCLASYNCQPDECCVSFIQPRRKRLFLSDLPPELEQLVNGKCVKRGVDTASDYNDPANKLYRPDVGPMSSRRYDVGLTSGRYRADFNVCWGTTLSHFYLDCILNGAMPALSGLYYHCPCMTGYNCQGTGKMALPDGEIGSCVKPETKRFATVTSKPCFNGTECASDECCQSDFRPIGKRATFPQLIGSTTHGHCQPMGTKDSGCLVKLGSGKPDSAVYQCPCAAGYTCHSRGIYEVPLGEIGTCRV